MPFSGGKGLRGPQSAGLLLGKREYIEAARMHTPPRGETIARGMKVNKEEVLGMLAALELYLEKDHRIRNGKCGNHKSSSSVTVLTLWWE